MEHLQNIIYWLQYFNDSLLENPLFWLQAFYYLFTPFTILFAIKQIALSEDVKIFQVFERIFSENERVLSNVNETRDQLYKIKNSERYIEIKYGGSHRKEELMLMYSQKEYRNFLALIYHFEFMGLLVKRKKLPFSLTFDLIPFPEIVWEEAYDYVKVVREKEIPDFLEDFQLLYFMYVIKRKSIKNENNNIKNKIIADIKIFILTNYYLRLFLKSKRFNNWVMNDIDFKFR